MSITIGGGVGHERISGYRCPKVLKVNSTRMLVWSEKELEVDRGEQQGMRGKRVEGQERRAEPGASRPREGPAEIKRTACHTSTVALISGSVWTTVYFNSTINRFSSFINSLSYASIEDTNNRFSNRLNNSVDVKSKSSSMKSYNISLRFSLLNLTRKKSLDQVISYVRAITSNEF